MFIAITLRTIEILVVSSRLVCNKPRPNLRFATLNLRSTSSHFNHPYIQGHAGHIEAAV